MQKKYHVGCCDNIFDWDNCFFKTLPQVMKALQNNFDINELPYVISKRKGKKWVEIARIEKPF